MNLLAGDRGQRSSYTINLTLPLCKILDIEGKIIKDKGVNRKWDTSNHGFISGILFQTNLISFYDRITNSSAKGNVADPVYLILNKALTLCLMENDQSDWGRWVYNHKMDKELAKKEATTSCMKR